MKFRYRISVFSVIGTLLAIMTASSVLAGINATDKKVAILPFAIHAEKDLSYLQTGIRDMLSTRLSEDQRLKVISQADMDALGQKIPETVTPTSALAIGKQVAADYVVLGSVTVFGGSVSTDGRVLDVRSGHQVLAFHEAGANQGDVIGHIHRFAQQIQQTLTGKTVAAAPEPQPAQPPAIQSPVVQPSAQPVAPSPNMPVQAPAVSAPQSTAKAQDIWITGTSATSSEGILEANQQDAGPLWKSRIFNSQITGIVVADMDGQGTMETAFIQGDRVSVGRLVSGRFMMIGEIEIPSETEILSIDAADINGNGIAELFLTINNPKQKLLQSRVEEWNGSGFKPIVKNSRWYFRVISPPGRQPMLLGQKRSLDTVFYGPIVELTWKGADYEPVDPQHLPEIPRWANVLGFNFGDILNNGQNLIVAFAATDYLRLVTAQGDQIWESGEPYGGNMTFVDVPDKTASSLSGYKESLRQYLSQRILIADADGDGKYEVIVVKNQDKSRRLFSRVRMFKGGHIECLSWDGVGMYPKWKTRQVSGYISDYTIGDIDNDGRPELVFSVVEKSGSALTQPVSFFICQDLPSAGNTQ